MGRDIFRGEAQRDRQHSGSAIEGPKHAARTRGRGFARGAAIGDPRRQALDLGATSASIRPRVSGSAAGGVHVAFEVTNVPSVLPQHIAITQHEGRTIIVLMWTYEAAFQSSTAHAG